MNTRGLSRWGRNVLEQVGIIKKKRIIDTPWERHDNTHLAKKSMKSRIVSSLRQMKAEATRPVESPVSNITLDSLKTNRHFGNLAHLLDDIRTDMGDRYQKMDSSLAQVAAEQNTDAHLRQDGIQNVQRILAEPNIRLPDQVITIVDNLDEITRRMCLSVEKRIFLQKLVKQQKPENVLDVGTYYTAYSACAMVAAHPEAHVITLEDHYVFYKSATATVNKLKTHHKIKTFLGGVPYLLKKTRLKPFDFIFLDHRSDKFKEDLELLIKENLIKKNALIVSNIQEGYFGSEFAEFLTYQTKQTYLKPLHGPPSSPLYVVRYIG